MASHYQVPKKALSLRSVHVLFTHALQNSSKNRYAKLMRTAEQVTKESKSRKEETCWNI